MALYIYLHCDHCKTCIFNAELTHNLVDMAGAVGVYQHIWRPEDLGLKTASQLIDPIAQAIDKLRSQPEEFKKYNPPNGWGDYDNLLDVLQSYLEACRNHPTAIVSVSR